MTKNADGKHFDLELRTLTFSKNTLFFCQKTKVTVISRNLISQLIRSSTSIGANYREANDALSKKDFVHKLKIARKEAKETVYWLELLSELTPPHQSTELSKLKNEAQELRNILSAIINNAQ